jgi:hypothetical protein
MEMNVFEGIMSYAISQRTIFFPLMHWICRNSSLLLLKIGAVSRKYFTHLREKWRISYFSATQVSFCKVRRLTPYLMHADVIYKKGNKCEAHHSPKKYGEMITIQQEARTIFFKLLAKHRNMNSSANILQKTSSFPVRHGIITPMKSPEIAILSLLYAYAPKTLSWAQLQSILEANGYTIGDEQLKSILHKLIFNQQVLPISEKTSQMCYQFREILDDKKNLQRKERKFR